MNEEVQDKITGQIVAITHVINAIIFSMNSTRAEVSASVLEESIQNLKQEDTEDSTPEAEIQSRDLFLENYLEYLRAVASRD